MAISRITYLLFLFTQLCIGLQAQSLKISTTIVKSSFSLVENHKASSIYIDSSESKLVHLAANYFKNDVEAVTGIRPTGGNGNAGMIIGTIGKSSYINRLITEKKIDVKAIMGKWESFLIVVLKISNSKQNILCVIGSDDRGTAFGVFELSRKIGVHPFYWWADIIPEHKDQIFISGCLLQQSPSVQYRGIFLNDEDWGLQPWAAKKMDSNIKDIGPKTYEKIFELLLRLKANYIWPAMHPCTKAFYFYPENGSLAADYGIVVGTSHCEPMMRNNVFEWAENYQNEYGVAPKEWRYDVNKEQIYNYWDDRIKAVKEYPTVTTVGMRGIHDGSMPGPKNMQEKVNLLQGIIKDQRIILAENYKRPIDSIAQIFCPYKEVLNVYNAGFQLPDDITLVWSDDNHGYIRQLSTMQERKRAGGSGVYYHLSYWGRPQDFLWLSSISPSLISYEMSKAYAYDARKLWVFNVGDIKPAEAEIQFAMELAWDVNKWTPQKSYDYTEQWAKEIFGEQFACDIASIKNEYYRLAASGKPEHLLKIKFREQQEINRLRDYEAIAKKADSLYLKIPKRLQDAFFELLLYPVLSAASMNEKISYSRFTLEQTRQTKIDAATLFSKASSAFESIQSYTKKYNQQIAGGKWEGIMSWHPRDLEVFKMPKLEDSSLWRKTKSINTNNGDTVFIADLQAEKFIRKKDFVSQKITVLKGLGINANGITILPFSTESSESDLSKSAFVEYKIHLPQGKYVLQINCLPTHEVNKQNKISIAAAINESSIVSFNIEAPADTPSWDLNVLQGFVKNQLPFSVTNNSTTVIRVFFPSSGVVLNTLDIFKIN